jgi:hypothetical protein
MIAAPSSLLTPPPAPSTVGLGSGFKLNPWVKPQARVKIKSRIKTNQKILSRKLDKTTITDSFENCRYCTVKEGKSQTIRKT